MSTGTLPKDSAPRPQPHADLGRWAARRRWARVGWTYLFLLVMSFVFLGPFLMGTLSSFKDDPNEYPPRLIIPQLSPTYLTRAWQLGAAGGGGWDGGLVPGTRLQFDVTVVQPAGGPDTPPDISVPARRPGAGFGALRPRALASEFTTLQGPLVVARDGERVTYRVQVTYPPLTRQEGRRVVGELTEPVLGELRAEVGGRVVPVRLDTPAAQAVQYTLNPTQPVELVERGGAYYLRGPLIERTPLLVSIERGQVLTDATLPPSDIQNFGRSLEFKNVTPGIMGYLFSNYQRAFRETVSFQTGQSLFLRWTVNSFAIALAIVVANIALAIVVANIVLASLAGYALARLHFPGRNLLFVLVLFVQMVPLQVTFISNYLVLNSLNLLNIYGLLVSGAVSAAAVFLMKQFFEGLPRELEEAASIDGATPFQTFWRVMLPQAGPALGALAITTFQGTWNAFFWPLVVLKGEANYTLPVGMLAFREVYGGVGDYGLILAGAVMSAIPVIILFVVFQRYFVESSAGVAVKG